jgi:hypothetical protein
MHFPSTEFDDSLAAVCDGSASNDQVAAVHAVLRQQPEARDEYLWQVELHSRLLTSHRGAAVEPDSGIATAPARSLTHRGFWLVGAVVVLLAAGAMAGWLLARRGNSTQVTANTRITEDREKTRVATATAANASSSGSSIALAGLIEPTVRFAFAADAPVIVGTGRREPIELGANVPYSEYGDTLHVWNAAESKTSRVWKDVRLWEHQRFALTPDGRTLLWSRGEVLDLVSAGKSHIDLGGNYHLTLGREGIRRIQDLKFSPDGRRLALLLAEILVEPSNHPLRDHHFSLVETIQILEFPSGQLLSEFPSSDTWELRIAFSSDGERILCKQAAEPNKHQLVERSTTTGEVLHSFEPLPREHFYGVAISADGRWTAAYDSGRVILIWDRSTARLAHTVEVPNPSNSTVLRISPDGRWLAFATVKHVAMVDLASGQVTQQLEWRNAKEIQWSADSRQLTAIAGFHFQDGNAFAPMYNAYPNVSTWRLEAGEWQPQP